MAVTNECSFSSMSQVSMRLVRNVKYVTSLAHTTISAITLTQWRIKYSGQHIFYVGSAKNFFMVFQRFCQLLKPPDDVREPMIRFPTLLLKLHFPSVTSPYVENCKRCPAYIFTDSVLQCNLTISREELTKSLVKF